MNEVNLMEKSVRSEPIEYIDKEVDMNFFSNYLDEDGTTLQAGCQRIHHCSCNCNKCSILQ